ncbi:hypothetical protein, partial [Streptomyces zhihengii]
MTGLRTEARSHSTPAAPWSHGLRDGRPESDRETPRPAHAEYLNPRRTLDEKIPNQVDKSLQTT